MLSRLKALRARDPTASAILPVRLVWVMYFVWLPVFIPSIVDLLQSRNPPHIVWTLLIGALFIAVYVWTGWQNAQGVIHGSPRVARPVWLDWLPIVVMALLSLVLVLTAGPWWGSPFIFTCAAACGRLAPPQALGTVAALILVVAVGGWRSHVDQATLTQPLFLMFFVGITVITSMRAIAATIAANRALRIAHEDLARLAVAEERLRFARDLHDLLGHTLSLIALKSELARRLVRAAPDRAEAEIGDVEVAARKALREVREAVGGYRQPTLAHELLAAEELLAAAGIALTTSGELPELPQGVEAALSWTVREAVTNVIRHSRARRCTVTLAQRDGAVTVEICDDGRAESTAAKAVGSHLERAGSGLRGLDERVRARGGQLEAGLCAGGGFRVAVSIPVAAEVAGQEAAVAERVPGERNARDGERAEAL